MAEAAKSLPVANVPTALTPVLVAGATWVSKAQVISLRAVNHGAIGTTITVAVTRGVTVSYLLYQYPLDVNGVYAETLHCILEMNDVLSVQAGTANAVDVFFGGFEGVD